MGYSRRTFLSLFFVTLLVLAYVHEQVSILAVSYSIEKKEREMARLSEDYRSAKFHLARLHSPSFLNHQLKSRSLNLAPPRAVQVVRVLKPKTLTAAREQPVSVKLNPVSWFGLIREAHAKPTNK